MASLLKVRSHFVYHIRYLTVLISYISANSQNLSLSILCKIAFNIVKISVCASWLGLPSVTDAILIAEHQSNNFVLLRAKMRRLPAVHQATLKALVEHLSRVVAFSDKNKMDAKNLAIVFGGVIFGEDDIPKAGVDLLNVQNWKVSDSLNATLLACLIQAQDSLMEDLIMNAHTLFRDDLEHYSPPLPPTPAGSEPAPAHSYGSKTTKFALPAPLPLSPTAPASPQDFTPRLPPRPANSIHPSLRSGQPSPTKERMEVPPVPFPARSPKKSSAEDSAIQDSDTDLDSLDEPNSPLSLPSPIPHNSVS